MEEIFYRIVVISGLDITIQMTTIEFNHLQYQEDLMITTKITVQGLDNMKQMIIRLDINHLHPKFQALRGEI